MSLGNSYFDYVVHPDNTAEGVTLLNTSFSCGIMLSKALGLATNAELIERVDEELQDSGPMNTPAQLELFEILQWVEAGQGVDGQGGKAGPVVCHLGNRRTNAR